MKTSILLVTVAATLCMTACTMSRRFRSNNTGPMEVCGPSGSFVTGNSGYEITRNSGGAIRGPGIGPGLVAPPTVGVDAGPMPR